MSEKPIVTLLMLASFGRSTGGRVAGNPLVLVANRTAAISVLAALRVQGIDDLNGVDCDGLRNAFTSCAPERSLPHHAPALLHGEASHTQG